MYSLDKKILRDIRHMKGQVLAITLVIVSGMAAYIMFISTIDSLSITRDSFYRDQKFADVFVSLKRAPESLKAKIRKIPGVSVVETRVCGYAKIDIDNFDEPVTARIVSLPEDGRPLLNRPHIRNGSLLDPNKDNEVLINETFAIAHGFKVGDHFSAIINGRKKEFIIKGIALSPEFVLLMRPDATSPDFKRYGVLWMNRSALAKSYNMDGAFNDVILSLSHDAKPNEVLENLDNILSEYGGLGAYLRKDQISHRLLSGEFKQLKRSSEIFPTIFIFVAAFLLNIVMSRTIAMQREQIAILKAFGYTNAAIGFHFAKLVVLITAPGLILGVAAGIWLGHVLGDIYTAVYRFPRLIFTLYPHVVIEALMISVASALAGTFHSLQKAAREAPAQAMRPEPPAQYRISLLEKTIARHLLSQPTRIIIRNIGRRPIRTTLAIIGIAVACATMIASGFFKDSVDFIINVQFVRSQKEDIRITFVEPTSYRALYEMKRLEGVRHAEAFRRVPVRFIHAQRSYRTAIDGIEEDNRLYRLLDENLKDVFIPSTGIVLNDYLSKLLRINVGDLVTVEFLEGSKEIREVPVVATAKLFLGVMGYMDLTALNRLMREGNAISGINLLTDSLYTRQLYRNLVDMPRVAGVVIRRNDIRNFYDIQARGMLFFTFIATLMACAIAFGVVYNSARIAFSERRWELSSLRVIGYTRGEISYILLGELGMITVIAIPVGFLVGYWLCAYIAHALASDLFRVPLYIEMKTYAVAAAVVLASASVSGLIVRRRVDTLDLVEVLKTRE